MGIKEIHSLSYQLQSSFERALLRRSLAAVVHRTSLTQHAGLGDTDEPRKLPAIPKRVIALEETS
jgi:hypothetical protein